MFLECPHCHVNYDITQDVADTVFVCHQCGQEFSEHTRAVAEQPGEAEQAPVRKTAHIWPWLLTILILLASAGFWVQKDAWLDNRQLRSSLINIGFAMPLRAKDWRIVPASVQPEWIRRKDGSRILRIRGDIKNLLSSDIPLPRIHIIFFSKTEPDTQIGTSMLEIVLASSGKQVNQESNQTAVRDAVPVSALGQRSFMVIAKSVPGGTGDFTLTPALR